MGDKVPEIVYRKMYGLVYSRKRTGKHKSNELTKDDDLILGILPKELMTKVACGRSASRYREKESFSEHCADHVNVKHTEKIAAMRTSKAECSKQSDDNKGFSIGNGQLKIESKQKESGKIIDAPMKQKRGADGEMFRAYLVSSQRNLPRLRPRKEVPTFRLVDLEGEDNEAVVGKRVKVYWSGSRRWFTGRIESFNDNSKRHKILYEDGDEEVLDLSKERFELEVMPTDCFRVKCEAYYAGRPEELPSSNAREAAMKENPRNVGGEKAMTKSSECKQKNEVKKEIERTTPKAHRKDREIIMKDLVSNVDVSPEKVGELVTNKSSDMEEPGKPNFEENDSKFYSKAVKKATMDSEAEETVVKSRSEFRSWGSEKSSTKGSEKAVDVDLKIRLSEFAKRPKGPRKRLVLNVKRTRTNTKTRGFGNVKAKVEVMVKSHITTIAPNPNSTKDKKEILATQRDVDGMNTNLKAESILEAESIKPCEVSYCPEPTVQISPEEAKPNILQGKVKVENGVSDKETSEGLDFTSEQLEVCALEAKATDAGR